MGTRVGEPRDVVLSIQAPGDDMRRWHLLVPMVIALAAGVVAVRAQGAKDPAQDKMAACVATPAKPAGSFEDRMKQMNPAISEADKVAWCLFLYVNSAAPANKDAALFETWADDGQTFTMNAAWPGGAPALKNLRPSILPALLDQGKLANVVPVAKSGVSIQVVPARPNSTASEETRRNLPAFNFIVNNHLNTVKGLQAAFQASSQKGQWISFPADSIEVKANWAEVHNIPGYSGPNLSGDPAKAGEIYHVSKASDGKFYALISMHIISKMVPNWTWATFEHENNPGRCEYLGCRDSFGAINASIPPDTLVPDPSDPTWHNQANNPKPYPPCGKSVSLQALFKGVTIDPAFNHYCLKGSQVDFTDPTGLPNRLGNSITESGFEFQSSCMSCHGHAAFDNTGQMTSSAGFDNVTGAPLGPVHGEWFWTTTIGGPWAPAALPIPAARQMIGAVGVDFVWSIAFCAVDDTGATVKPSICASK